MSWNANSKQFLLGKYTSAKPNKVYNNSHSRNSRIQATHNCDINSNGKSNAIYSDGYSLTQAGKNPITARRQLSQQTTVN
jgi:hypothetical protein